MTTYSGSCHCGAVQYEVQGDFKTAIECNCSMCRRKGSILAFASKEAFTLKAGADAMTDYQFHKHALHHTFCKTCGVTPFIAGKAPDGKETVDINLRTIEDLDLDSLDITQVDGKSF